MASVSSKPMQLAEAKAREISAKLDLGGGDFDTFVAIAMEDGSHFFWDAACFQVHPVEGTPGAWVMVFTEHYGDHVFSDDDVISVAQYQRVK